MVVAVAVGGSFAILWRDFRPIIIAFVLCFVVPLYVVIGGCLLLTQPKRSTWPPRLNVRTLMLAIALLTLTVGAIEFRRRAKGYGAAAATEAALERSGDWGVRI